MTNENEKTMEASIEAILFTMGQAVERNVIETALGITPEEFDYHIERLRDDYRSSERGLQLIQLETAYQICTKSEYYDDLVKVATTPVKPVLTPVMLEVLSVIAYKQPVTRGEIERIRGVNSDYSLNRLVEFGLVQEAGRLEAPGKPMLFETTEEFLRKFGLQTLSELPPVDPELMREVASEIYREQGFTVEGQISLNLVTGDEATVQNGGSEEKEEERRDTDIGDGPIIVET